MLVLITAFVIASCVTRPQKGVCDDSVTDSLSYNIPPKPCIAGHIGQDTIIGNFTRRGMDTIWVVERVHISDDGWKEYNYHTESNNLDLSSVELFGRSSQCAFIVNEGDLDGDGKDEWGWMRGTFASSSEIDYHLLHLDDNNRWKETVIEVDGDTRSYKIDVVKKGKVKGQMSISVLLWSEDEFGGESLL